MTLEEFFACPKGVDIFEWEQTLQEQKKIKTQMRRCITQIETAMDALEVLEDENGSERYQAWERKYKRAVACLANLQEKLDRL